MWRRVVGAIVAGATAAMLGCAPSALNSQQRQAATPRELDSPDDASSLSQNFRLPFRLTGPWILIEGVEVNRTGPYAFLLDTGASGAGRVDASLAQRLRLPQTGEVTVRGPTGSTSATMPIYTASSLSIGALNAVGVELASRDYSDPQSLAMRGGVSVQGILGMGLFEDLLLTVDYPASELRIARGALPKSGRDILGFSQEGATLAVEIDVAGAPALARLDTGSPAAITIGGDLAANLRWSTPPRVVGKGRTAAGKFDIERATLDGDVRIGPLVLTDPEVDVVRSFEGVTIGSRILRRFALTIDQCSDRIRLELDANGDEGVVTPASAGVPSVRRTDGAPASRRYGIAFAPPADSAAFITILDVLPGEVAAYTGIRAGDRIPAMNGRAVRDISPDQIPVYMRKSPLILELERSGATLMVEPSLED